MSRRIASGFVGLCAGLALLTGLSVQPLAAQPTGGQVVAGSATIAGGAGTLTVTQTSDRAILTWQDFSIGAGDLVRFIQPDAASATLNRVVSGLPSALNGRLEANGRVFLINPNGILVGADARIDTAGFLASTLDVTNQDFLAGGDLHFSGGSTAAIQNLGTINALGGDVFLIARQVENAGALTATAGAAGLAAGSEILLTTGGNERLFVQASSAAGTVVNAGAITAATAELKAAGGNAYALAINNAGTVRATGSAERGGQVWLVAKGGAVESSGTLAAANVGGTQGGEVRVLGDSVTLADKAVVDVSGAQTGGTALLGGDFQGRNAGGPNARTTTVASGATINARGVSQGGRVIVWSDELTHFGGAIGAQGTAGGFVEVSGKQALRFDGRVDTGGGTLLLDPANITVQATAGDQVSTFGTAQIATLLGSNHVTLAADTDITWNAGAALDYNGIGNAGRTLTLQAGNNILFSGTISDGVAGGDLLHVVLNSDRDASGVGYINLAAGAAITTSGGNVTLGGGATPATGFATSTTAGQSGVQLAGASLTTAGGNVTINGSVNATGVNNGIRLNATSAIDTGAGSITLTGRSTSTSSSVSENNYAILLNRATLATTSGHVTLDGANTATISTGAGGIDLNGQGGTSSIVTTSGNISLTGSASASGGASSGHRGINLINSFLVSSTSGAVTLTGTGRGAGLTNYGVGLNNSASVKTTGTGNVSITGTGGGTTGFGSGVQIQGLIETTGTGNISITGTGGGTAGFNYGVYIGNTVRTTGGGNLTITGQGSLAGTTTNNEGVKLDEGTVEIQTGTNRTLTINGTAGTGTNYNIGVNARLGSAARLGTAVTGSMNVTGIGAGSAGGTGNWGVLVEANSAYESLGAGAINLTGTGGLGSDNHGIKVSTGTTNRFGSSTMTGPITLTADMIDLQGSGTVTVQSSGNLQIKPNSGTATIGIGDGAVGTLNLNATEIGRLVNGFASISIGHIGGGAAIDVRTQAFHDPLTIHTPQNGASITVNGALSTGSGTSAGSITLRAADNIVMADSTSITTQGQAITLNSDADRLGVGYISLGTSAALASNGGAVTLGGGSDPTTGFAVSRTANQSGVQLGTSATIASTGGNVIVNGSVSAAGLNDGILLSPSSSISSGAGSMTLTGQASSTTTDNYNNGIYLNGGSLTATSGAISVTGTTSAASTTGAMGIELSGLSAGGKAITTTSGAITLNGTASTNGGASGTHYGVVLHDGFTVGTADGAIVLTGTGRGAGDSNHGIALDSSTVQATGSGTIALTGTGAAGAGKVNHGIFLDDAAAVTTASGTLSLSGTTSSAGNGLNAGAGGATLSANGSGAMTLTATSNGGSLAKAKVTAGALRLAGAGDFTLTHVQNNIATLAGNLTGSLNLIDNAALTIGTVGGVSGVNVGANSVTIQTLIGNLSLASGASVVATGAGATPLVLAAAADFINSAGASALDAGTGRWLVWSTNPANDTRGGLPANFKQYNATYLSTSVAQASGNGFLYKLAPSVAPGLQGTVSRAYNGTTAATLTSSHLAPTGAVDGDTVNLGLTAASYDTKNVGTGKAVTATGISITSATNATVPVYGYQLSATTATGNIGTITAAELTYTANTANRLYGSANPAFSGTVTGFVNSETLAGATTGSATFGSTATTTSNVGTHAINGSGLTANNGNYTFSQAAGNATALTINPASLIYTADLTSRLYGAAEPTFSGTVTGFANSETLAGATTGTATFGTTATATSNIGTYAINGSGLTANNGNYTFTQAAGNATALTINSATLTYTATPTSRTYGSGNPTLGGTINNFVNGETQATATTGTLTFATTATVTSNVGTYAINGSGLTANNGNYTFTQAAGNATALTINPASLVLTGTRVYDGSTIFAGSNLTATGVNGETFTVTGAGATGNLTTKNVQTNQALASVGGLGLGSGNSGAALSTNYNGLSVTGSSVSVTPKALTITGFASDNKVYNGTTAAVIATPGTLNGVVSGDSVDFSQTGATFDTKDVGTDKTVTLNGVTLTGSGDETNYTHTATVTDLSDITPATLTYTATPTSRTYGSANPTFGGTIDDFVNSETQATATTGTLTFETTATVSSNVGTYAINGSGLTANNGNYTFTQAAGNATALTINPANLVLTGTRVYDGTTIFAGTNLTATGVNGESFTVTGAGATGNLGTRNVQTGQLLASVSGLGVGTGNSGAAIATNYNALATTGSSVSVTPVSLTASSSDVIKTYDGGTSALGTPVVTVGTLFGADALAGGTFVFVGKDVGAGNKTVTVAGVTVNDGNSGANYTLSLANNTTSTINPASLTLSGTRAYDGSTIFAGSNLIATGVNGETFTVTGAGATGNLGSRNVQTGQLLASVNGLGVGTGNSGAAVATNYNALATTGSSVSVTAAALTVSTNDVIRTYDGGTSALGSPVVTVGTLFGGDALAGGTFAFVGKDVGAGNKTVTVAGVTVNDGNSGNNYTLSLANNTTSTINPANLVLTGTRVYDGSTIIAGTHLTATGVNGESFAVTGAGASGNLSTRNVQAGQLLTSVTGLGVGTGNSGAAISTNYNALATTGSSVSVTAAGLTVSSSDVIKTYDGGTSALGTPVVTVGTLFGADALAGGTFAFVGKDVGAGNKTVTVAGVTVNDGNSGANYTLSLANNTTSTINPATLTLSGTRIFDGTTIFAGSNLTATGVNGESFTVTGSGATGNLGTRNVQIGQLLASVDGLGVGTGNTGAAVSTNYSTLATTGSSVSVTPKDLTITADDQAKVYGAADPTLTATYTGLVNTDDASVVTGLALSTATAALATAGSHAITATGAASANYTITLDDGTLTVTPATLAVTADAQTKVYGNADPALTYGVGTLYYTDTVSGVLSGALTRTAGETVAGGPYQIGLGTLTTNANYTVAYTGNELTITPATLTYVADAASRYVGVANPAFSGTVTGFVAGDAVATATTGALAFDTSATVASPVGTYEINGSGLTANHGNYVFVQAPPNATALTINPVGGNTPLTITADDKAKLYGAALPTFTASFNGFINGDTSASVTGLQFSTSATMSSNVGTYTITPFGATAPSTYLVGYVPGTLTINPALLNIFADNKSSVYGAGLPVFTASLSGFVNGDTSASVTGLQFSSTASVGSNVGTYAITPFGATAANYTPVYHPGALTISPAALTLTAGSAQRPFGTANPPFSVTTTGLVNGDTAEVVSGLVISTPATATSPVGSYAITPSGGTATNYSLTYISGILQVNAPTVIVGTDTETVVTIDDEPVVTDEFAVIQEGDRLVLVVVNEPGDDSAPVDERLALTLQEAIAPVVLERVAGVDSTRSTNTLNFGNFEPVSGAGGATRGGGGGGAAQPPEPGLFRESTVNMGGFNIVYHEAVTEALTQAEGHTALGSSYREFSDAENPQVNIVRPKADQTPSDSPAPGNAPASL